MLGNAINHARCIALMCRVLQVVFKPIPEVWGYFSVKGGGGIHEFSDSQVGRQLTGSAAQQLALFVAGKAAAVHARLAPSSSCCRACKPVLHGL